MPRLRPLVVGLLAAVLLLVNPVAASASAGDLDSSFDDDGVVTTQIGSSSFSNAVAIQPDQRIVTAGGADDGGRYRFALARYETDGDLDPTFSDDGTVTTALGSFAVADGVAIQPGGKIVAAGTATVGGRERFAVARYESDGDLDPTFSGNGLVTTVIGGSDARARAVAIQPDGKIVTAGYARVAGRLRFALARYETDGDLDTAFGPNDDGKLTTAFGRPSQATAVAIQVDGAIVAAGHGRFDGRERFAVARYETDGDLDPTFSGNGKVTTGIGGYSVANGVAIQPDGRIVAAGYLHGFSGDYRFALARYESDGALDPTFGGNGKVSTRIGAIGVARANAVAIQPDGGIVAAGVDTEDNLLFALARYGSDGARDASFGDDGVVTTPTGTATAAALQSDGKIVAAGFGDQNVLARYLDE